MEENVAFENFEMRLNETAKGFLKETAKWAYFLSILGYIGIGFIVIAAIFAGTIFTAMGNMGGHMGSIGAFGGTFIMLLYLAIGIVYFFPIYYLNKFASNLKVALKNNNTDSLTVSLGYLKSHYKFIGIMMLVMFAIYALVFVFAILAALTAFAS